MKVVLKRVDEILDKRKRLRLVALGDIQYGVPYVNIDELRHTIEKAIEADCFFVGTGDYVDVGSPSTKKKFKAAGFYDVVHMAMDEYVTEKMEELLKILAPTRGRWLAMVSGHHNWEFKSGNTVDQIIAERLNAPYAESTCLLCLYSNGNECQILIAHGEGSGSTPAAPLNRMKSLAGVMPTIDIFLIGHYHRNVIALEPRVIYKRSGIRMDRIIRKTYLVVSGGYLDSYIPGDGPVPYTEQKYMAPRSPGSAVIEIDFGSNPPNTSVLA